MCGKSAPSRSGGAENILQPRTSRRTPPPGDLGLDLWNDKVLNNDACKTCAFFIDIADGENGKDGYRANLGCVEGLDPLALDIKIIDGKPVPLVG